MTKLTIAQKQCDVWRFPDKSKQHVIFETVTEGDCVPVAISEDNISNPGFSFRDAQFWINYSDKVAQIPALPSQCKNAFAVAEPSVDNLHPKHFLYY